MLVEILLLIFLVLGVFHYFTRCSRIAKYVDKLPGPFAWPLLGSLPYLMVPHDQVWPLVKKWDKQYYPIYKLWSTHRVSVTVLHPDDIEVILSSIQYIEKSIAYNFLHSWFGTGLLTSTGAKWQKRRKILTPAFHFTVLQKYFDIIIENGEKTIKLLKSEGEYVQNLASVVTDYTLNVICEAAMGTSLQGKGNQAEYRNAIHDIGDTFVYRLMRPWFQMDWTFHRTSAGQRQKKALQVVLGFSKKVINERKEYHEKTKGHFLKQFITYNESIDGTAGDEYFGYRKKRLAMLDLLISAQRNGAQIDDAGIDEEVNTFMFEGHDTSAMSLCFTLLLIAEHKDAQERIRSEVNEVLKESGGKMGISENQRFTYLELCIKESLRLYPSVPFIMRAVNEDLQLKNYIVPKGTTVKVHIYSVHRNPDFWTEPEKFDPERFLPDRFQGQHPFSYIPFSAGPRNCIGQKFAMMELKAFIAHIVHNFYLEPIDLAHKVPLTPDLVLRPARPIRIKLVPIEK